MICPMVASVMRRYYGDGKGYPPAKEPDSQCAKEGCAWWFMKQECCSIVAIANYLTLKEA